MHHKAACLLAQHRKAELVGKPGRSFHKVKVVTDIADDRKAQHIGYSERNVVYEFGGTGGDKDRIRLFLFEPAFEIFIAPMCHAPCKVAHHHEDRRFVFWIAVELFVRSVFEQIALTDVTGNLVPLYLEAGKRANNILVGDPVKRIAFVRIRNGGINIELAKLGSVEFRKKREQSPAHAVVRRHRIMAYYQYFHF